VWGRSVLFHVAARYTFEPTVDYQIALAEGDAVVVLEEAAGWLRGYIVTDESKLDTTDLTAVPEDTPTGVFPASYVELQTEDGVTAENSTKAAADSVKRWKERTQEHQARTLLARTETALRQWRDDMAQLLRQGDVVGYHGMRTRIATLLEWRRQLESGSTTGFDRGVVTEAVLRLVEASGHMQEGLIVPTRTTNVPSQQSAPQSYDARQASIAASAEAEDASIGAAGDPASASAGTPGVVVACESNTGIITLCVLFLSHSARLGLRCLALR